MYTGSIAVQVLVSLRDIDRVTKDLQQHQHVEASSFNLWLGVLGYSP